MESTLQKEENLLRLWPELPKLVREFNEANRDDPNVLEKMNLALFSYIDNIEESTRANKFYRHVINTTLDNQLVLMSLLPNETIPREIHDDLTQFIRIEEGYGKLIITDKYSRKISEKDLGPGTAIQIPSNTYHEIQAVTELKLYTIYSIPHHRHGLIQERQPIEE